MSFWIERSYLPAMESGQQPVIWTPLREAHFVRDAGETLVCCVPDLMFLTDRGPAVWGDIPAQDLGLLGFSMLPGSIILWQGPDPALLTFCGSRKSGTQRGFLLSPEPLKGELPLGRSAFVIPTTCSFILTSRHVPNLGEDRLPSCWWWEFCMWIWIYLHRREREPASQALVSRGIIRRVPALFGECKGPALSFVFCLLFRIKSWKMLK